MSDQAPSSTNHRFLHSKIRIKSSVCDLPNLTGTITEAKRGGWFITDNPKIVRPIRAREFDVLDNDDEEEGSHFSDGDKKDDGDVKDGTAGKDTKESPKDEHNNNEKVDDDNDDEVSSSNNEEEEEGDSNNYDKDQFLKIGTTIKITSGEHNGRICTISERRVGIFLKISVDGDIRLMQPDEIEVIQFKDPSDDDEEEEKQSETTKKGKKKNEKDFGHKKYIGASVRVDGVGAAAAAAKSSSRGRKSKQQQQQQQQGKEATVENAFSGEWYLVSDPDIVKALDPAQFEVVKERTERGAERKRKRDDDDESEEEEEDEEAEEEEEEDDFLSSMQFCGEIKPEKSTTKSLRKRGKKINYKENGESSGDDMESWHDSEEEEKDEKEDGKNDEVDDDGSVDNDDGFVVDDASVASVRETTSATKPVVDVTETSTTPKEDKVDAKSDGDVHINVADSSNDDDINKMEEEPISTSAPVILQSKKGDNNKMELLLSGMSHLPPDTKIDVLNRKTGRVMRGDEAILLKDLPAALLNHADYEPIVPPPQSSSGGEEGEAGDKEVVAGGGTPPLPVDHPKFDPWDNSVLVGVTVVVRSGPYKDITAKIKEVRGSRWVLDHEAVTTTLRSSDCHFIDDGNVDKDSIAAHYQTKKKTPMPAFVKQNWNKADVAARVRRVGRTDANVRVSNVVIPQTRPPTRVRASAVEGKRVMVTGGEFRGLGGTISSCIPGGWYLVSNLYDDDHELDVLIKSEKLELIDGESSKTPPMQGLSHEQIKSSIHSKASELRMRMEKKRKDEKNAMKMRSL